MIRFFDSLMPPNGRPLFIFGLLLLSTALLDGGNARFLQWGSVFSITQSFGTLGAVALGLGLVMMIGEYDISVAGTFAIAGVIAVRTGQEYAILGLVAAVTAGIVVGLVQGLLMIWLRMSSIAISLGGLLTLLGLTYMLADGATVAYTNADASHWLNETLLGGSISHRSAIVVVVYVFAALVIGCTRTGRDLLATGSNREGAALAGVRTDMIRIGVMIAAGGLSALGGALLAYSLASASATSLADVLVPATAAVIIGGVSLGGGRGRPAGIAVGVLAICLLRSGLSAVGMSPYMLNTITGVVLAVVAIYDAPLLGEHIAAWRSRHSALRDKQEQGKD